MFYCIQFLNSVTISHEIFFNPILHKSRIKAAKKKVAKQTQVPQVVAWLVRMFISKNAPR